MPRDKKHVQIVGSAISRNSAEYPRRFAEAATFWPHNAHFQNDVGSKLYEADDNAGAAVCFYRPRWGGLVFRGLSKAWRRESRHPKANMSLHTRTPRRTKATANKAQTNE